MASPQLLTAGILTTLIGTYLMFQWYRIYRSDSHLHRSEMEARALMTVRQQKKPEPHPNKE